MTRQHRQTSKEGERHIKPHKPNHKSKITDALIRLKIGGNQEEIALIANMRPDQVWKRLSELEREGTIFNTGITRKLKSGIGGIVWQLVGHKVVGATINPKTQAEVNANKTLMKFEMFKQTALFS